MRIRKKFIPYVYPGVLILFVLGAFILFTDPKEQVIESLPVTYLHVFLLLLFSVLFFFFTYFFKSSRRGVLAGLFLTGSLILHIANLSTPFYLVLLFIITLGIELYFRSAKKSHA